ncbi:MAG: hypothetical protein M0Q47_02605 [Methanothrix sp.]|jgi:hypothetical protein|uniref:hypothetical protein n=1 Tax=Methanothrix sp. TaxID=90426 RepID=UPI0025CB7A74|nr:hypothetical protein [Methanothrix sp.]MCK9405291.1 hypothetical protein [Methanothrix sp.]
MAELDHMPPIIIPPSELLPFGQAWAVNNSLPRTPPFSSLQLTHIFDHKVGSALAKLLGDIPVIELTQNNANPILIPSNANCVEVGPCRVVGGVRPQNFDVGYRPDGIRIAFDSKTLNDTKSVQKNYQNMINDLGTESSTVHTRFPYAVVAFMVVIPNPCLLDGQRRALTSTLKRLTGRNSPVDVHHKAEAISLVLWNPNNGEIDKEWPEANSPLRIEQFSQQVEESYVSRYAGMPPHH